MDVCLMCKEPINSPLTVEEIDKHIELWLPGELSRGFADFQTALITYADSPFIREPKPLSGKIICIYCYVKEVYQWLDGMNGELAERFLDTFSFGFAKRTFRSHEEHADIDMEGQRKEFGICDECGEYTDELVELEGEWVCVACERFRI